MNRKTRSMGIRTKLIVTIIPIVLVMIVAFFALARNTIINLSGEKLAADSEVYAKDIGAWTGGIFSELRVYKTTIENAGFQNDDEILAYMQTTSEKYEAYPSGLYMGDDSGVYLDGAGWVPDDDWILTERDWYVDGLNNKDFAFGEPYYDSQTGDVCVSASVRMDYDNAATVLAVVVYLDYLSELVSVILRDNIDIAFFATKDSKTILAHPDTAMMDVTLDAKGIDSLYANVSQAMSEGKTGEAVRVKGDNGTYYVSINPIENTEWYLVTGMEKSAVLAELTRLEIIMSVIAVVAAALLIVLSLQLTNRIVKPVGKVTNVLSCVAEGDFTQQITVKGNDEIAGMSKNMQYFLERMRSIITDISGIAERLSCQSEENERVSSVLKDSSNHQKVSVDVLNNMVAELSEAARRVAEETEQLSSVVATAESEGSRATVMMKQAVDASESGKQAMQRVSGGMSNIRQTIENLAGQIARADEVTKSIENMVNMIKDIADETNLLSLNASIEAARAGEAGRGFAVVAEQISSLAENSKNAAANIEGLTVEISETMGNASRQMEQSVAEVSGNTVVVTETGEIFGTVFDKVVKTDLAIRHMVELVEEVNKVAAGMSKIAAAQLSATGQIEESARELGDYTRTVGSNSDTVAENADKLEQESKNLTERIRQFTV